MSEQQLHEQQVNEEGAPLQAEQSSMVSASPEECAVEESAAAENTAAENTAAENTATEKTAEHVEGTETHSRPTLSASEKVALLEALLLASGEPLSVARIQDLMGGTKAEVLELADQLQAALTSEARGIEVVVVAEKLQLRTKAAFADYVRQLMAVRPRKLSQAALETLSVIAYQQPVVKSEIDKIRGVDVAPTVKTLLERGLVKILGYQASVGQPALYGTTEVFLQVFGLSSLSALPAIQDLKALAQEPGEASPGDDEDADESPPELPIVDQPVPDVN